MGNLFLTPHQNWLDNNAKPLAGGLLYAYQAGTTTPVNTWQDAALTQINSNPIILDAGGFATVWLDPVKSYKFLMRNELGAEMWSVDNYQGAQLTANLLVPLNFLLPATGSNSISNGSWDQNWNWSLTGSHAVAGFAVAENAPSTNTNPLSILGGFGTRAGSTVAPFEATAHNGAAGFRVTTQGDLLLKGSATLLLPDMMGGANQGQIHQGPGNLNLAGGAFVDSTNTVWTATNSIASVLQVGTGPARGPAPIINGGLELFVNSGLTPDTAYSPTPVFGVNGSGVIQTVSLATGGVSWLEADASGNITPIPPQQIIAGAGIIVTQLGNGVIQISHSGGVATLNLIALNPTSVQGGTSSTGTVALSNPAPAGGAVVTLSSNDPAAQVPASVTILAGASMATFTVTTTAVSNNVTATITANYGVSHTANLTVIALPPTLASVSLNPASVVGGASSSGTVTLTFAAPSGGVVVTLLSSNTSAAQVPASVTVPQGATVASFAVTTSAVSFNTTVVISGTYGGTQSANLTVNAPTAVQPVYGGVGVAGGTGPATVSGTTVTLNNGTALNQLQTAPEQVGQSWPFSPSGQVIYLLLYGNAHTFLDQNNTVFAMNVPIAVTVSGTTMYLYQSTNVLLFPFTVKVNT